MTPAAAAARRAVQTRNATEEAILDAARAALAEKGFEALTMDAIARKAFVSRTAVYFYFPNKRAVVDRLIQQCFSEMYLAASPYLDGDGDPRRELRARARARGGAWSTTTPGCCCWPRSSRARAASTCRRSGSRYIMRFVERAEARIARDQEHGIAPDDIAPRLSAQALLAMVENHITRELVLKRGDANESIRMLAELWWRAVYSRPGAAAPASARSDDSASAGTTAGRPRRCACTPPSTCRISPVIAARERREQEQAGVGDREGRRRSQPSGAWRSQICARPSKPSMFEAATVCSGPAATRLSARRAGRGRARGSG